MRRSIEVNLVYFGALFALLALVHTLHIQLLEKEALRPLFIFYGLCQCLLETALLAIVSFAISRLSRSYRWLFVGMTLVLLLLHLVDFPLVRFMDLSAWQALHLVAGETWENFLEMLYSTHIGLGSWVIGAFSLALLFFLGLGFYYFGERRRASVSLFSLAALFLCLPGAMLVCDCVFITSLSGESLHTYARALPWKRTLCLKQEECVELGTALKKLSDEKQMAREVAAVAKKAQRLPDLFIFIVESLRSDYLTPEVAPHLYRFAQTGICAAKNNASANGTHLSWFSAFYGKHPFYFADFKGKEMGSPALAILKQMGYETLVFSATRLNYYKMDQLLFGKDLGLASSIHCHLPSQEVPVYESDRRVISELMERAVQKSEKPRCHIVFLESTHFDYSFPEGSEPFAPFDEQINYLDLLLSKRSLPVVQNRYRNAIHYLDSLLGQFFLRLQKAGKWEDAVVALTGDHGEEFYEEGHLFHASNLNTMQISVPLLFKLGNLGKQKVETLASHIDLFPTLLHYLTGSEQFYHLFDGHSILGAKRWPYTLTGRYNGSHNPYEFCIETPKKKLLLQFKRPLAEPQELRIMGLRSELDRPEALSLEEIQKEFGPCLDRLLESPAVWTGVSRASS